MLNVFVSKQSALLHVKVRLAQEIGLNASEHNFSARSCHGSQNQSDIYKLDRILAGEALDEMVDALITEDRAARLAEANSSESDA